MATRVVIEAKPPNYIVLSLIVFLLFCWIFGLIGLIVGLQVRVHGISLDDSVH